MNQLVWESAGTDEPRDQNSDALSVPCGYWSLGPAGIGQWSVELIAQDGETLDEIADGYVSLGCFDTESAAKHAAQVCEDMHASDPGRDQ